MNKTEEQIRTEWAESRARAIKNSKATTAGITKRVLELRSKETGFTKCTVHTMSPECFKSIDNYLKQFPDLIGNSVEETKKNIMRLPYFISGCYTYIQARAFAEYYHSI